MSKVGDRFLAVPYCILARQDISSSEKLLLSHIWSYGANGCWETNETMGRIFNVTPRQITTWISHLKRSGSLLWLHGKNYHRTLWARQHPAVAPAKVLVHRGQVVLKETLCGGGNGTPPPGRNLPGRIEGNFQVTRKNPCNPPGRMLPQTKNTMRKETARPKETSLVSEPAPALLEYQRRQAKEELSRKIDGLFKSV